jgi:hypothetical protein
MTVLILDPGDTSDLLHHPQHHRVPFLFRPSGANVAPDPNLPRYARAPEESLGRLLFLDNNLYEVGRRTGLFAMNPGQSPCDCFLLIVVYRTLG